MRADRHQARGFHRLQHHHLCGVTVGEDFLGWRRKRGHQKRASPRGGGGEIRLGSDIRQLDLDKK